MEIKKDNKHDVLGIVGIIIAVVFGVPSLVSLIYGIYDNQKWYLWAGGTLLLVILLIMFFCIYIKSHRRKQLKEKELEKKRREKDTIERHKKENEEYIKSCIAQGYFQEEWKNASKYMPLEVQDEAIIESSTTGRKQINECFIDDFFDENTKVETNYVCLLGDSGSGKTSALVHLLIDYVRKYTVNSRPFDIRIYSMSVGDVRLWNAIDRDIPMSENRKKCILLLDALDENLELQQRLVSSEITPNQYLQELADRTRDFARVVISCRQQFFDSMNKEPDDTRIRIANGQDPYMHWKKYYLAPFNTKQVESYLQIILESDDERAIARKMINENDEIFFRPLILSNIKDLLVYCNNQEKETLTTKDIYDTIVLSWLKREPYPDGEKESHLSNLLKLSLCLAAYMYKHHVNTVDDQQYQEFLSEYHEYGINDDRNLFRARSLLNRIDNVYRFSHKSLYDYFLAYWFFLHPEDIGHIQGLEKTLKFFDEIQEAVESDKTTEVDTIFSTKKTYGAVVTLGQRCLADRLYEQHRYDEAERRYKTALIWFERIVEMDSSLALPDLAIILNGLALVYSEKHMYGPALKEFQRALDIRRKLSAEEPDKYLSTVAETLNNIALLHKHNNENDLALKEYQEALDIYRKLSKDNRDTYLNEMATVLNNLGVLHKNRQDYNTAMEKYQEALGYFRELSDKRHDAGLNGEAMTLLNIAYIYRVTYSPRLAIIEIQKALNIYLKLSDKCPAVYLPQVAMTLANMAILYGETLEYDSAEQKNREALELYRQLSKESSNAFLPYVALTLINIADLCKRQGQSSLGKEAVYESIEIYTQFAKESPAEFGRYKEMAERLLNEIVALEEEGTRGVLSHAKNEGINETEDNIRNVDE